MPGGRVCWPVGGFPRMRPSKCGTTRRIRPPHGPDSNRPLARHRVTSVNGFLVCALFVLAALALAADGDAKPVYQWIPKKAPSELRLVRWPVPGNTNGLNAPEAISRFLRRTKIIWIPPEDASLPPNGGIRTNALVRAGSSPNVLSLQVYVLVSEKGKPLGIWAFATNRVETAEALAKEVTDHIRRRWTWQPPIAADQPVGQLWRIPFEAVEEK